MRNFFTSMKESARELKNVRSLAIASMLTALSIVLGFFSIQIGQFIKIGFGQIATSLTGMLFGPVVGGILGGLGDIINYLIKPTGPFFPGFTLSSILGGFIYGVALYKKPVTIKRIFFAKVAIKIFVDLTLTTTWLSMLYGKAFMILLPMRALKALIMLPIETAMLYIILTSVSTAIFKINKKEYK